MQRRGFENDEGTFFLGLIQITLGVFIGALAALFAYEGITSWRLEQAAKKVAREWSQQQAQQEVAAERAKRQQQAARDEVQRVAEQQRTSLEIRARLERERQQRKDLAWSRAYTPSPTCQIDPATHSCANEHMAARRRFEASYTDNN